jgi:hypothetical protein
MNSLILRIGLVFMLILIAGCSPAEATVTPAPIVPADTATSPPPTATATAAPPTASPTPIPTANFTLADIIGIWFRSDPDRGNLYLTFSEDGSYRASHGTPDDIVHSGRYTLEDRLFTFVNGWNCSPLGETVGVYVLRLAGGGKYLTFEPLDDVCPDRPSVFKSYRWDRVLATPTPVP